MLGNMRCPSGTVDGKNRLHPLPYQTEGKHSITQRPSTSLDLYIQDVYTLIVGQVHNLLSNCFGVPNIGLGNSSLDFLTHQARLFSDLHYQGCNPSY